MASESRAIERYRNPALVGATVAGVVLYAWVGGGLRRFTWPATAVVALPGAAVLLVALRRPPRRLPAPARLHPFGARAWAALFLALCLWELNSFLHQPDPTTGSPDHPTLSVLSDPVLASHPARAVALWLWLWWGWGLLRR